MARASGPYEPVEDRRWSIDPAKFMQGERRLVPKGRSRPAASFFAGYPITPSTEVVGEHRRAMPKAGGVFVQMEDEIACDRSP